MNYDPNQKFNRLVGVQIAKVEIAPDRESIVFHTNHGPMKYVTEGDCCSRTWIEGVDDWDALFGTVTAAEEIEMPNLGNIGTEHNHSVDQVSYYGLKITTEKGRAVIDYRNDSNGYYGGSLESA